MNIQWKRIDYSYKTNDCVHELNIGNFNAKLYEQPRGEKVFYFLTWDNDIFGETDSTFKSIGSLDFIGNLESAKQWAENLILENLTRHVKELQAVIEELNKI